MNNRFKFLMCAALAGGATAVCAAESISEQAKKVAAAYDRKERLEKNDVRAGQKIQDIGSLTIDDFLKLDAVPDGLGAAEAQQQNDPAAEFSGISAEQAALSVAIMRKQGIELPDGLEDSIRKNPEKAAQLMNDAFQKIKPAEINSKEDIAKQRRAVIREAEKNLGVSFKTLLETQKELMSGSAKKRRRGGKK